MKNIKELMIELGFRKDSSTAAQEAFIRHLIRVSTGVTVRTPSEDRPKSGPEQLSFFDSEKKQTKAG